MTDLATALTGAAARGELFAHFQPQLDPETDRIVGAEALARWDHPGLGLVPPLDFITVAEQTGLIDEVGEAMVELGCAFAARIAGSGIQVAINVSALQLADATFADRFVAIAERHGVPRDLASCHTAQVGGYVVEGHVPASDVRRLLAEQVTGRVRWRESVTWMAGEGGVTRFAEAGAGKVLSGMIKRIAPGSEATPLNAPADLEAFARSLADGG